MVKTHLGLAEHIHALPKRRDVSIGRGTQWRITKKHIAIVLQRGFIGNLRDEIVDRLKVLLPSQLDLKIPFQPNFSIGLTGLLAGFDEFHRVHGGSAATGCVFLRESDFPERAKPLQVKRPDDEHGDNQWTGEEKDMTLPPAMIISLFGGHAD